MKADAATDSGPVRFGESFELDLQRKQLRRYGQSVRLERIPLEVLILLVQRRGEIVSREEIVARVWGGGTYLDTDNAINGAIRKIRQVLKDNPEEPKYIQTVTGKGYRFFADLQARGVSISPEPEQVPAPEPKRHLRLIVLVSAAVLAI